MQPLSYDELWVTAWGDQQNFGPVHRHQQKNLIRTVSNLKVRSLLEVGCGSGNNLATLADTGKYDLMGADIAQEALDLAKQRVPQARLVVLNIEKEFLTEQFDLVMSLQVMEHILNDMVALQNIAQMAKKFVLISTLQGKMRPSEISLGHVRNYSAQELRLKVEAVGLEVLQLWGWGFPFYSPLYRTIAEWLPGGPPLGPMSKWQRFVAKILYQLYQLNWPGRGDVLYVLAKLSKTEI